MRALALGVVGLALLVTGVLVLALPTSADDGSVCGSGLTGVDESAELTDDAGVCEDEIALRRVWGWPVAVAGLALVGGVVVGRVRAS